MYGVPIIQHHRASEMTFGAGLELRSTWRSNPLGAIHPVILSTRRAGSRLRVGSQFSMTGGTLCADELITIGDRVLVGANCTIIDTDFEIRLIRNCAVPNRAMAQPRRSSLRMMCLSA